MDRKENVVWWWGCERWKRKMEDGSFVEDGGR